MSKFSSCPNCGREASGGLLGGVYIMLHKCNAGGHHFCSECANGDRCPLCSSADVRWDYDKAFCK